MASISSRGWCGHRDRRTSRWHPAPETTIAVTTGPTWTDARARRRRTDHRPRDLRQHDVEGEHDQHRVGMDSIRVGTMDTRPRTRSGRSVPPGQRPAEHRAERLTGQDEEVTHRRRGRPGPGSAVVRGLHFHRCRAGESRAPAGTGERARPDGPISATTTRCHRRARMLLRWHYPAAPGRHPVVAGTGSRRLEMVDRSVAGAAGARRWRGGELWATYSGHVLQLSPHTTSARR